jgi:hypothetical protein
MFAAEYAADDGPCIGLHSTGQIELQWTTGLCSVLHYFAIFQISSAILLAARVSMSLS